MFQDRNLTITDVVSARFYGQDRDAGRTRIRRQDRCAKRERIARSQPCFLTVDEHAGLVARGRGLLDREAADPVITINVGKAIALLGKAETSWKRPGHVVVMVNHGDAVLLGNVFRRLNGFGMGLARLDEIAGREAPAGAPIEVFASELIAALNALDAAGETLAATILRTATIASTTWRIHVPPADAGWLSDILRAVGAPQRFLAALAPIAAAAEGSAS